MISILLSLLRPDLQRHWCTWRAINEKQQFSARKPYALIKWSSFYSGALWSNYAQFSIFFLLACEKIACFSRVLAVYELVSCVCVCSVANTLPFAVICGYCSCCCCCIHCEFICKYYKRIALNVWMQKTRHFNSPPPSCSAHIEYSYSILFSAFRKEKQTPRNFVHIILHSCILHDFSVLALLGCSEKQKLLSGIKLLNRKICIHMNEPKWNENQHKHSMETGAIKSEK